MGYYSEVLIMLTDGMDQKLRNELKSKNQELQEQVNNLLDKYSLKLIDPENKDVLYYWDFIKWYTHDDKHFPAICWVDKQLQLNDEIEDYRYIIVGEEITDIQDYGSLFNERFDPYPESHIHFNKS